MKDLFKQNYKAKNRLYGLFKVQIRIKKGMPPRETFLLDIKNNLPLDAKYKSVVEGQKSRVLQNLQTLISSLCNEDR